jgi:hypothetical protein
MDRLGASWATQWWLGLSCLASHMWDARPFAQVNCRAGAGRVAYLEVLT